MPRELFDEPLDTWRLSPDDELFDERSLPLGQRRIVVIRDRARNERPPAPEWHKRWRTAGLGPLKAVPLRAETLGAGRDAHTPRIRRETPRQAWVRLSEAEDGSVPVFCGQVGSGEGLKAMAAALAAGHPIALWRSGAHDHADCVEFHERAGRLLAEAARAERLHAPVLSLRKRVAADADADTDAYDDFDPDPDMNAATNATACTGAGTDTGTDDDAGAHAGDDPPARSSTPGRRLSPFCSTRPTAPRAKIHSKVPRCSARRPGDLANTGTNRPEFESAAPVYGR